MNDNPTSFATVLTSIANESLGVKNAKDYPEDAVNSGLLPVLQDHLSTQKTDEGLWGAALPDIGKKQSLEPSIVGLLNSFYHTEEVNENHPKNCKGVFIQLSEIILTTEEKRIRFEMKMGRKITDILAEEFISNRKSDRAGNSIDNNLRIDALNNSILGFIEISSDCDQAQKKTKLNRYILSALIPELYEEMTFFDTRLTSHDGIYRAPKIVISGRTYILKISYKYQIGTLPLSKVHDREYENSWLGKPLFRLREQILADISFRCAQYSTRPGIISFS